MTIGARSATSRRVFATELDDSTPIARPVVLEALNVATSGGRVGGAAHRAGPVRRRRAGAVVDDTLTALLEDPRMRRAA